MVLNEYRPAKGLPVLKRVDQIGGIAFFIAVFLRLQHLPYATEVMIIGLAILAISTIFKASKPPEEVQSVRFIYKLSHFTIANGLISALFVLHGWPMQQQMYYVFFSAIFICICFTWWYRIRVFNLVDFYEKIKFGGALIFCFSAL